MAATAASSPPSSCSSIVTVDPRNQQQQQTQQLQQPQVQPQYNLATGQEEYGAQSSEFLNYAEDSSIAASFAAGSEFGGGMRELGEMEQDGRLDYDLGHMGQISGGSSVSGGDQLEEEGEEEEDEKESIDLGVMDFQFVDVVGSSSFFSPFEFAEEIAEPMDQENMGEGDEPSMLRAAMKRMKYERKISASLYAFNGIPECLKLRLGLSGGKDRMSDPLANVGSKGGAWKVGGKEQKEEEKDANMEVEKQQMPPQIGSSSSSSSSFLAASTASGAVAAANSGNDGESLLWSSLDLPPICLLLG